MKRSNLHTSALKLRVCLSFVTLMKMNSSEEPQWSRSCSALRTVSTCLQVRMEELEEELETERAMRAKVQNKRTTTNHALTNDNPPPTTG